MPHPPEPVLCLGGTQSSAFGQLSGLFYLNIPKCVKQKEDDQISLIVETLWTTIYMNDEEHDVRFRYP